MNYIIYMNIMIFLIIFNILCDIADLKRTDITYCESICCTNKQRYHTKCVHPNTMTCSL